MELVILYGSETGNAQDVAEQLVHTVYGLFPNIQCKLRIADAFASSPACFTTVSYLIIVCSTTGQGDPPSNMRQQFWSSIMRRSLTANCLSHLHFAVLGLGDSSYVRYNFVAKKVFRRLQQLGGVPLVELGLLDEQHPRGWQGGLEIWLPNLWRAIQLQLPEDERPLHLGDASLVLVANPKYRVELMGNVSIENVESEAHIVYPRQAEPLQMLSNERVTSSDHFQDTRLLRFSLPSQPYQPGDVLNVQPMNFSHEVASFLSILQENDSRLCADTCITLHETDPNFPVPPELKQTHHITLKWLASHFFDIHCIPRWSFFKRLSAISEHPDEKEKLEEWTSAHEDGVDDLYRYCYLPRRTLMEVLTDLPNSVRCVKLAQWFDLLTPLRSRAFSIASSPRYHVGELHLLVAKVEYASLVMKTPRLGLCSTYLAQMQPGDKMLAFVSRGSLKFPSLTTPLVLIGPGTGIAPLRSILLERLALGAYPSATSMSDILLFGCRYSTRDFYFSTDFERLTSLGVRILTAFSRENSISDGGVERRLYVQDRLYECGQWVWDLLVKHPHSCFIVTGNSKSMPQEVRATLLRIAIRFGEMTEEEAERTVGRLEVCGRYQTETWS